MVTTFGIPGYNFPVGIGYVSIPSDVKRDEYITLCLRTGTISLRGNDGAFYNRVPISKDLLDKLDFPEKVSELGTTVVYINEPTKNQLIIIGTLLSTEQIGELVEGQFKIERKDKKTKTTVQITGSAKQKYIGVIVNTEEKEGGEVYISVINKSKTAKLNVNVSGDIKLQSTGKLELESFEKIKIVSQDKEDKEKLSTFTQDSKTQHFESEEWTFGKGNESVPLGNTLQTEITKMNNLLTAILNVIKSAPIPEPGNGTPSALQQALNTVITTLPEPDFSKILSEKVKIE